MRDSIFREYDIRGKIGSEFIIDETYDLTRAIVFYLVQHNPNLKTIAVGMDGRLSSPAIKERMIAALTDGGFNIIFIGMCTSPVLSFALYELPVDAGLMITASHNPKEYNGIKISLGTHTVWGKQIKEIGALYRAKKFLPPAARKGTLQEIVLIDRYVQWLKDHFPTLINMPLSLVLDAGNGAGGTVLPKLVKAMEWKHVDMLCMEVDGSYPHHEADPTVEKNMADVKKVLATTHASLGIGIDGDGDRMAAMTKSGFLVPGDQLLAVFAQAVLKEHPHSAVVFDVKASSGLIELLEKWGAKQCIAPCGHAIIKDRMEEENALIGGELSCHFFFRDRHFGYDDGVYALLRLLEIVFQSGKSLDELIKVFPKKYSSPEIRLECAEEKKQPIIEALRTQFEKLPEVKILSIDGIRVSWPYGWGNVRASNTQPVLSMRFEANSAQNLIKIKQDFIAILGHYFDPSILKEKVLLSN